MGCPRPGKECNEFMCGYSVEGVYREGLKDYNVISVGCFGHSGDVFTDEQKIMLDDMHKRKIDMADEIFVINVDGYIGNSTKSEIEYAETHNKKVNYLVDNK